MAPSRSTVPLRRWALPLALAILACACGALSVGWWREHQRADCWQEAAEEGLSAAGGCAP